jgi:hypothetical protein
VSNVRIANRGLFHEVDFPLEEVFQFLNQTKNKIECALVVAWGETQPGNRDRSLPAGSRTRLLNRTAQGEARRAEGRCGPVRLFENERIPPCNEQIIAQPELPGHIVRGRRATGKQWLVSLLFWFKCAPQSHASDSLSPQRGRKRI